MGDTKPIDLKLTFLWANSSMPLAFPGNKKPQEIKSRIFVRQSAMVLVNSFPVHPIGLSAYMILGC